MSEASRSKPNQSRCTAMRRDGRPCTAPALASGFCFSHDPKLQEKREAARSRGGRNRAKAVRLRGLIPPRLLPVYDKLEEALTEVHDGVLEPKAASAMAALARALVAVLTAGELEERVRALEQGKENP